MEELLSLKWNNHRSTFLHILAVLRDKQMYTDATLACDGKLYSVHKLVLSTCSDYFSSMLDRTACKSPVIVLKDIRSDDLEALLDYMYLGEVNVRQSDLATLIKAAECLRVKGLAVPDDEPPPRKVRGSETQSRRVDTIGSPPAKRKRRSEVDDGRDDGRPIIKQDIRRSSPVNSSASSRPKSPIINSHASPIRSNSTNNNNSQPITNNSTTAPRQTTDGTGDNFESVPYVKVEMEDDAVPDDGDTGDPGGGDSSTGDIGDSFNLSNDDFKEEDPDGADMNSDLPEFLQQANANYPQSSFAGPSFQPDLPWQQGNEGGGGSSGAAGLAGSFAAAAAAGLSFGNSSQQDSSAGAHNTSAGKNGWSKEKSQCSSARDPSTEIVYCHLCGKGFKGIYGKYNIKKHMIIHSGAKIFNCQYCQHTTNKKGNLKTHVLSVHNMPFDDSQHSSSDANSQLADGISWPMSHELTSKPIRIQDQKLSLAPINVEDYQNSSTLTMDTLSLPSLPSSNDIHPSTGSHSSNAASTTATNTDPMVSLENRLYSSEAATSKTTTAGSSVVNPNSASTLEENVLHCYGGENSMSSTSQMIKQFRGKHEPLPLSLVTDPEDLSQQHPAEH